MASAIAATMTISARTSTEWNAGNQLFGFDGEGYL